MRRFPGQRWRLFGGMSLAVIVGIGGGLVILTQVIHRAPQTVPLQVSNLFHYACHSDPESLPCLQQHYQDITKQRGPTAAFDQLKTAYVTDNAVKSNCHQLAHVIGRTEAETVPNLSLAFSQGDNFCWAGYYHGVMEMAVSKIGIANLSSQVGRVCAEIKTQKPYSFYHYNCVHGLGHGIMAVEANNLPASLQICDAAGNDWEQQSCQSGVFMQNVMASEDPDNHTDYLKPDQPMYPCTTLAEKYKYQCYLMQTSYALRLANENFTTIFQECAAVEAAYQAVCYQSLGRDASGKSVSDVAQTNATCMLGQTAEAQSNCIIGAVKDFISFYHSDQQANLFCQSLNSDLQPTCQATKQDYYSTL